MTDRRPIDDETLVRLRHGGPARMAELAALAGIDTSVRQRLTEWDGQDAALRALYGPVFDEPVPKRHRDLLDSAAAPARSGLYLLARVAAVAGLVAIGVAGGWTAARIGRTTEAGSSLADVALRTHATYVVEVAHPIEVPASDEAHLVGWLSKRLGHRITPPDLDRYGFRLMGGRVVPDANGAAAMMMYEDDIGRRITLYVARAPNGSESEFRFTEKGTAKGFWWIEDDLGCAVIGDLPRETLRAISVKAYDELTKA